MADLPNQPDTYTIDEDIPWGTNVVANYHYCIVWKPVADRNESAVKIYRLLEGGKHALADEYISPYMVERICLCDDIAIMALIDKKHLIKVHLGAAIEYEVIVAPYRYGLATAIGQDIYYTTLWERDDGHHMCVNRDGGETVELTYIHKSDPYQFYVLHDVLGIRYVFYVYAMDGEKIYVFDSNGDQVSQKDMKGRYAVGLLGATFVASIGKKLQIYDYVDNEFILAKSMAYGDLSRTILNCGSDMICAATLQPAQITIRYYRAAP